jgi:hypothetical protein
MMPTLTRSRSPDAREECWQIFYGDVGVGTIARLIGIPNDKPRWGWACGFYPGSKPVNALRARPRRSTKPRPISKLRGVFS